MQAEEYWRNRAAEASQEFDQTLQCQRNEIESLQRRCSELLHELSLCRVATAADVRNFCLHYLNSTRARSHDRRGGSHGSGSGALVTGNNFSNSGGHLNVTLSALRARMMDGSHGSLPSMTHDGLTSASLASGHAGANSVPRRNRCDSSKSHIGEGEAMPCPRSSGSDARSGDVIPVHALMQFLHEYSNGILPPPESRRKRGRSNATSSTRNPSSSSSSSSSVSLPLSPSSAAALSQYQLYRRMLARQRLTGNEDEQDEWCREHAFLGESSPPTSTPSAAPRTHAWTRGHGSRHDGGDDYVDARARMMHGDDAAQDASYASGPYQTGSSPNNNNDNNNNNTDNRSSSCGSVGGSDAHDNSLHEGEYADEAVGYDGGRARRNEGALRRVVTEPYAASQRWNASSSTSAFASSSSSSSSTSLSSGLCVPPARSSSLTTSSGVRSAWPRLSKGRANVAVRRVGATGGSPLRPLSLSSFSFPSHARRMHNITSDQATVPSESALTAGITSTTASNCNTNANGSTAMSTEGSGAAALPVRCASSYLLHSEKSKEAEKQRATSSMPRRLPPLL